MSQIGKLNSIVRRYLGDRYIPLPPCCEVSKLLLVSGFMQHTFAHEWMIDMHIISNLQDNFPVYAINTTWSHLTIHPLWNNGATCKHLVKWPQECCKAEGPIFMGPLLVWLWRIREWLRNTTIFRQRGPITTLNEGGLREPGQHFPVGYNQGKT